MRVAERLHAKISHSSHKRNRHLAPFAMLLCATMCARSMRVQASVSSVVLQYFKLISEGLKGGKPTYFNTKSIDT